MGRGRHSTVLIQNGFCVFGVDRDHGRVSQAQAALRMSGLAGCLWVADLERCPLGTRRFDLVVCTRYLQRSLWPALADAVIPGGFILYETFTTTQLRYDWGPRSGDHLLHPDGELCAAFQGWDVWTYEECEVPTAEARLVARKPQRGALI